MNRISYTLLVSTSDRRLGLFRLTATKVEQIYSWSRLTPLDQVKIVILGQVGGPARSSQELTRLTGP